MGVKHGLLLLENNIITSQCRLLDCTTWVQFRAWSGMGFFLFAIASRPARELFPRG